MRHEGESSQLDSSDSEDKNDDDDGTGAKENTRYNDGNGDINSEGNGDGGGDRNSGNGGGSAECMRFLIPNAISETFDAMAQVKASLSKKSGKTEAGKK